MTRAPLHCETAPADGRAPDDNAQPTSALPRAVLDADAIRRLRELDPTGESHLLTRVFNAFETSLNRLLPQLVRARAEADAASVRLVAHTLKSSSATVGAIRLSRLCADVEVLAHELRLEAAASGIEQMLLEAQAVREALRRLVTAPDTPAGAA